MSPESPQGPSPEELREANIQRMAETLMDGVGCSKDAAVQAIRKLYEESEQNKLNKEQENDG